MKHTKAGKIRNVMKLRMDVEFGIDDSITDARDSWEKFLNDKTNNIDLSIMDIYETILEGISNDSRQY